MIQSKKRYLDFLKFPSDQPPEILEFQSSFDTTVNSLNKRILSLRYKIQTKLKSSKEKFTNSKISELKKKILFIQKNCEKLNEKKNELDKDLEKVKNENIEELDKVHGKIEMFKDMANVLNEDKSVKEAEVRETEKDLQEIEKIYKGMNEIFVNVQMKLDERREEINGLNLKYFDMVVGTEDLTELEEVYKEMYVEGNKKKAFKDKLKKKFRKLKNLYEKIGNFDQGVRKITHNLQDVDCAEPVLDIKKKLTDTISEIQYLKTELDCSLQKPLKILQDSEQKSNSQHTLNKSLLSTLDLLNLSISEIDQNPNTLQLNSHLDKLKSQENNTLSSLSSLINTLSTLSENQSSIRDSIKSLISNTQSCDFSIYSLTSKIESLETQKKSLQSSKKNEINSQEELKYELLMLQKKANKTPQLKIKHSPDTRKLKNIMNQATVLFEELIKKDSVLLKKTWEVYKVNKDFKHTQKVIEELAGKNSEFKKRALGSVSEEVEKKDKEIEMLKEILKGNASEVKAKDVQVNLLRKMMEDASLEKARKK